jgi:sugar phosphate isomerase/epimerase
MKVGVLSVVFGNMTLTDALDYIKGAGAQAVEIGTGNYPGDAHCPVDELLADAAKLAAWKGEFESRGLEISALSCHGNPLHPDAGFAAANHEVHRKTVQLAAKVGVSCVVNFSGCPGGPSGGMEPIWVTAPWPEDFGRTVEWQWSEKVIPYWSAEAKYAADLGINIGFEMHPNFVVYNPETLLKLRAACGSNLGANFDPSHLFWQGIDPVQAVRALAGCIWHVHAKDCKVDPYNTPINGVLDTKPYTDEINRSWIFRTVGYGHGVDFWNAFVSNLRLVGYDGVLSIEHEDSLMSGNEGLQKAIDFLRGVVISEPAGEAYWA